MTSEQRAKSRLVTSMFIFGTIGLFVRWIPLPSSVIALSRAMIGMLFLSAIVASRKMKISWPAIRKNLIWLVLSGAFLGFNWIFLFEAYRYTSVAISTLCYYMAPIFVVVVSPVILREKLTSRKIFCVAVALFGMVCISGVIDEGLPSVQEAKGIFFGLTAAVLYACIILFNKKIKEISAYDKTIVQLTIAAVLMLPYCLITEDFTSFSFDPRTILLLLLVGILHTGITYFLYFGSMEHISGQSVAIISYIDPVVAVLLSVLVLHEPMLVAEGIGAFLILGSAMISELPILGSKR